MSHWLAYNREIDPLLFDDYYFIEKMGEREAMSDARDPEWTTDHMYGPLPVDACGSQPPHMEGLTHLPVYDLSLDFIPAAHESTSYLAPPTYLENQRDSPISDFAGSAYAWSNASGPDVLGLDSSLIEPSVDSTTLDPVSFPQSYFPLGNPEPSFHQDELDFDPQEINSWNLESQTSEGFYQPTTNYPTIDPLSHPAVDISASTYPAFGEPDFTSVVEQWFSMPPVDSSPIPETIITPSSAPTASFDSPPIITNSPAPSAPSDFETYSSRPHSSPPRSNPADLSRYGIPTVDGAWRCAHPGCTSQAVFRRGCDLRKHFNRHRKHFFCRYDGCSQSHQGGFSSKKDRARHEAKHNPGVVCEWDGCGRVFSRVDNMKDHVRRIHRRGASDSLR